MNNSLCPISLLDLSYQADDAGAAVAEAIARVSASGRFILGEEVESFEAQMAAYIGSKFAIGVSSGTDALLLALMALDIGKGDLVATTPFSFFATAEVIARVGAIPLFVDIDLNTFNMNPALLEAASQKHKHRLKAVMPVHLFGRPAEIEPIRRICCDHGLPIIEDAAQAIGASIGERKCGNMGDVACFSFFPSKNLGCWGDGGLVTTNSHQVAQSIRTLRSHGTSDRIHYTSIGGNFRLDALQAAILSAKLPYLESWTDKRRQNAKLYNLLFTQAGLAVADENKQQVISSEAVSPISAQSSYPSTSPLTLPQDHPNGRHVFNQYVILARHRDQLQEFLRNKGIGTAIYYPIPLHMQPAIIKHGYIGHNLPDAEQAARSCLALPLAHLDHTAIERVVATIAQFYLEH